MNSIHDFLRKTLGGLTTAYYVRHFLFGLVLYGGVVWMSVQTGNLRHIPLFTLCQFLYPYSRFVYESVVGFILGRNIVLVNPIVMLVSKIFTITLCWTMSVFIAPFGLAYLYFYHSKQERQQQQQPEQ
ncbi:hypothetical protein [Eikenella corrodens]|uniref:Uncharacterized protein n=1 Tax=Eikenella corrodens TaxID=539 RepID=A0A3S9SGP6_EIKCO|nr:hypothetical protein [Eikenella corrodens]AZR58676.1 hypothetical protein ELB75_00625 [Eikenella corrodens]